ncbi:MAG: sel1 repeat family protein [Colwellia sp.]|nr:sel1 repeat family protein [Colwellia sp.]
MKKFITTFCAILLACSFTSSAVTSDELLKIETYNIQLKSAIRLYQSSDFEKALPELEVFAKRGDKLSQYIVGTMYLNAQGTEQDLLKSYAWLTVANEQRSQAWAKPLKMLDSKLPEQFLTEANDEAQNYIEQYGVKAQHMKCRGKKSLGSKKGKYTCKKVEVKSGHYFVSNPTYLALN